MENDKVMVESANLESRRSFLNRQIAALTKENDGLGKNYQQQLINVNRLQKLYKEASSRAATGEGFKQEAKNLQKELQQMSAQAKKVQDELEATKWHEGDLIAIDVRDQKTGKSIKDVMFTFMGSIDALKNRFEHIKYTRLPARRAGVFIGEAPEPEYYPLSKEDIVAGRATITFTAPGYEEQTAEIEAGTKTFTFYLVPAAPKAPPK